MLHSHQHEYDSRYPSAGYSKHEYADIPTVAFYVTG